MAQSCLFTAVLPALLIYNLAMTVIDAAVVAFVRRRTLAAWLTGSATVPIAAVVLALAVGVPLVGTRMGVLRLLADGLFFHTLAVLAIGAVLLWRLHGKTAMLSAILALSLSVIAIDAFLVEPQWLEVARLEIASEKISRRVRLVVLADLQTDHFSDYEHMVFRRALAERPDVLLLAGDYLQASPETRRQIRDDFRDRLGSAFSSSTVAYAVRGNVDRDDWAELFSETPIVAVERTRRFDLGEIQLTCLAWRQSFWPNLALPAAPSNKYHIVLGHSPAYARGRIEADLLLAGHTHGGQVRLPLLGSVSKMPHTPRAWMAGQHKLPSGATLVVSRGVGMERDEAPRLRFLCRPELVVIDLVPKAATATPESP
ncbi:MAG: metallophosphoesterase [Thermoguttaceae bacterium]|nr:metallophosphoesterase [Thermoguttaceae bacterium]